MQKYANVKSTLEKKPKTANGKDRDMGNAVSQTLYQLNRRPVPMSEELHNEISKRCGISADGIKLFRDKGLSKFGEKAYARGNEIHIADNVPSAETEQGQKIVLHEAAHIVQQGLNRVSGSGINMDSSLEAQANAVAEGSQTMNAVNFSMPAASLNSPVQGFSGFRINRKKASDLMKKGESKFDSLLEKGDAAAETLSNIADTGIRKAINSKAGKWLLGINDRFRNWNDDRKEKKKTEPSLGEKIKNKYEGSKLQSAVNTAKGGLSKAGSWVKDKAAAVKDKISGAYEGSKLKEWIDKKREESRLKKETEPSLSTKIKDKLHSAGEWVKGKYEGSKLQGAVNSAKSGLSKAGGWVKDKYQNSLLKEGVDTGLSMAKKGAEWLGDKKNMFKDKLETLKDDFAEHEKQRYLNHKAERDEGFKNRMSQMEDAMSQDNIGERIARLKGVTENRQDSESKGSNTTSEKVQDYTGKAISAAKYLAKPISKTASKVIDKGGTAVKGAAGLITSGIERHKLNAITDDSIAENAQSGEEAAEYSQMRQNMQDKNARDMVDNAGNVISGSLNAAGKILPGAGGMISKAASKVTSGVTGKITGSMAEKSNWRLMKNSLFGSQNEYKAVKQKYGMRKRDMQAAITNKLGTRDINESADIEKQREADMLYSDLQSGNTNAQNLAKAVGADADTKRESLARKLGAENSIDELVKARERRRRKERYFA